MEKPIISIIGGKGAMGQLFASFFREHGIKVLISDLKTKLTNKEAAAKADIVIVAVSMGHSEKVIKEIAPQIRKDALLADITSVKQDPVKAMRKCKGEVLGMHPMFGSTNPIPGQMIIVCPVRSGKWTDWLLKFFKNRGVRLEKMTPKENDELMAHAQGVIHFADIVFAHSIYKLKKPVKDILKITSSASNIKIMFAARLIAQSPHLYGNIQIMNKQNIKALKQYVKSSKELLRIIKKKNLKNFEKYFSDARKFFGNYANKAFEESTWVIDEVLANRRAFKKEKSPNSKISKNSLGVLGPRGTFSDIAASNYDQKSTKAYLQSIDEIFEAVAKGKIKEGIVPIENKLHGTVRESLDALFHNKVHIAKEMELAIHHCLITLPHAKNIKTVISHSQALNQCKKYLRKYFPKAQLQALASTATAIEKLITTQDSTIAVIAPKQAAATNKLKVHAENIANQKDNSTRFIVIRKGEAKLSVKYMKSENHQNKTSTAFYFSADSAGSLATVFKDFADAKINMNKIESRPSSAKFGQYVFYLDFDGHISDSKVKKTLKKVEKKVAKLKILGSY